MERYISERVIVRLIRAHGNDHCQSCHDNDDLMEVDLGKNRIARMCCGIYTQWKDWKARKASQPTIP